MAAMEDSKIVSESRWLATHRLINSDRNFPGWAGHCLLMGCKTMLTRVFDVSPPEIPPPCPPLSVRHDQNLAGQSVDESGIAVDLRKGLGPGTGLEGKGSVCESCRGKTPIGN